MATASQFSPQNSRTRELCKLPCISEAISFLGAQFDCNPEPNIGLTSRPLLTKKENIQDQLQDCYILVIVDNSCIIINRFKSTKLYIKWILNQKLVFFESACCLSGNWNHSQLYDLITLFFWIHSRVSCIYKIPIKKWKRIIFPSWWLFI